MGSLIPLSLGLNVYDTLQKLRSVYDRSSCHVIRQRHEVAQGVRRPAGAALKTAIAVQFQSLLFFAENGFRTQQNGVCHSERTAWKNPHPRISCRN